MDDDTKHHQHITPGLVMAFEMVPQLRGLLDHLIALCPVCEQAAEEALAMQRESLGGTQFDPSRAADQAQRAAAHEVENAARELAEIEEAAREGRKPLDLVKNAPPGRFRGGVLVAQLLEHARVAGRGQDHEHAKGWAALAYIVAKRTDERDDPADTALVLEAAAGFARALRQAGHWREALTFLDDHREQALGVDSDVIPIDVKAEFELQMGAALLAGNEFDKAICSFERAYGLYLVLGDKEGAGKAGIYLGMALRPRNPQRALELTFWAIEEPLTPYLRASAVNEAVTILLFDLRRPDEALSLFHRYEDAYFHCGEQTPYVCARHTLAVARFKAAFGDRRAALEQYANLLEIWQSNTSTAARLDVALVVLEMTAVFLELGAFEEVETLARGAAATFAAAGLDANALEAFELIRSAAECRRITVAEVWRAHRYLRNPEAMAAGSFAVSS